MRVQTCVQNQLTNAASFTFFGEPALSSLNFSCTQTNAVTPDYLKAIAEYLCTVLCLPDASHVFAGENFVRADCARVVRLALAPVYFKWFMSDATNSRVHASVRAVTTCFNSLSERLRYYRASFDVSDTRQTAALVIFDVNVTDWRAMLNDANVCLENAKFRADRAIENALRTSVHEAKSSLMTFSSYVSEISNDRIRRLVGLFELECDGDTFAGRRDSIVDTHCKQLYVYNFVISYEVVRKSELILDDYAHGTCSLQIIECDEYSCGQVDKAILEVVRAYDYFSASSSYAGSLNSAVNTYSEMWREPEAWSQSLDHFIRYLRAITTASKFSVEEFSRFELGVIERTGVQNVRLHAKSVRDILLESSHGDVLLASTISQMYAHQLRVIKSTPAENSATLLLDDIVEQDYQTNERIWRYTDTQWSSIAADDSYLVTYIYAMVSSNWLTHAEILRSVVRIYSRTLFRLLARMVIDYNVSPYESVENVLPSVERFMDRKRKRVADDSETQNEKIKRDRLVRRTSVNLDDLDERMVESRKRARSVASSVESDEPIAKIFVPLEPEE